MDRPSSFLCSRNFLPSGSSQPRDRLPQLFLIPSFPTSYRFFLCIFSDICATELFLVAGNLRSIRDLRQTMLELKTHNVIGYICIWYICVELALELGVFNEPSFGLAVLSLYNTDNSFTTQQQALAEDPCYNNNSST